MNNTGTSKDFPEFHNYLEVYIGIVAAYVVLEVVRTTAIVFVTTTSSKSLHDSMFKVILHAKLNFFERTPIGM